METSQTRIRRDFLAIFYALGLSLMLAALVGAGAFFWNELEQSKADNAALANQVRSLGAQPVVTPGPTTKGLSAEEVRSVVTDELSRRKVSLTQAEISQVARVAAGMVAKPKDGKPPTPAQVQGVVSATILTFCAQDSQPCRGGEGPKGKDAPPITEAQLSAAVGAFCGEDAVNCRGPRGETGRGIESITKSGETVTVTYTDDTATTFTVPDGQVGPAGPQGQPGRGITSTKCQVDGTWLFTYNDGSAETVEGPCRVGGDPPPSVPAR